jgi:hypothetical protein
MSTQCIARGIAVVICLAAAGCRFNPSGPPSLAGGGGTGGTAGVGGTGGTPMIPGITALAISPQTATLTVMNGGPAQTQQYTVTATVNGQQQDVTGQVSYVVNRSDVVTISRSGLATTTGTNGGIVTITVSSGGITATATLTVMYSFTGPDPGMAAAVPADASTRFTSTSNDQSRAPQLVYPNDGVLFPPNISGIEIHFLPGSASNTLFEVSVVSRLATITSYIRCVAPAGINGCIYTPDAGLWSAIARSNAGQGPAQLTVRGTDDAGSSVGASSTFQIQFAADEVLGGLYYWTSSNQGAIMRWDFAGSTTTAQPYLTSANTDRRACIGCHALSLDGTKLVASAGGQNDGRVLLWNVATNTALQPFPLAQRSQFSSWNADGSQFVGMYGDPQSGNANTGKAGPVNLLVFDGNTGAVTETIDLGGLRADHPDWSKVTGSSTIVFSSVDPTAPTTDQKPSTGAIAFVQKDASGAWGPPQTLVPSELGKNRYYPAISPDGVLVLFDESTCTAGTPAPGAIPDKSCNADTDLTATIFVTRLPPGDATPLLLANANQPGVADNGTTTLTSSFPKWAPFVTQLDESTKLYWFTFSSSRQYGLRSPPAPANMIETTKGQLIWMVGMKVGLDGGDPTFTAFCLPFQDITTSNHIAQWTTTFVVVP